jgi:hypothetical protein
MELFLQRSQKERVSRPRFELWAKFDLSPDEKLLMNKYQPQSALLSEDEPESRARKWRRSVITGGALAVIMCLVIAYLNIYRPALSGLNPFLNIEPIGSVPTWIGMLFLGWYVFTTWVFAHIREDIIVADILRGRSFRCKSIVILLEKEDLLKKRAQEFRQFLEAMKTWGGMDIITINPGEEASVKSMGDGYVTT